jgi:HK97 family phage prohead protease
VNERTIEGRIVPYGVVGGPDASAFARRCFGRADQLPARGIPLVWNHRRPDRVGRLVGAWERSDGLHGRFELDPTQAGEQALQMIRSGLRGLSPGFAVLRSEVGADAVKVITTALLREVSLVADPAYGEACVIWPRRDSDWPHRDTPEIAEAKVEALDRRMRRPPSAGG